MCICKFAELINQECTKTTNALLKLGSKKIYELAFYSSFHSRVLNTLHFINN